MKAIRSFQTPGLLTRATRRHCYRRERYPRTLRSSSLTKYLTVFRKVNTDKIVLNLSPKVDRDLHLCLTIAGQIIYTGGCLQLSALILEVF
jgi:hypothetical protein